MNKVVALALVFALPAFAQQKQTLVPSYEQSDTVEPAVAAAQEAPLYARSETWIIAGTATAVVIAIVAALVVAVSSKPAAVEKSSFMCSSNPGGCDAWINPPSM